MFKANQRLVVFLEIALLTIASGCIVKRTVHVKVPPNIGQDKTASLDELMNIIRRNDDIKSLASGSLKMTLTTGRIESGKLQKYRRAPGHILLKRPDSLFLHVGSSLGPILDLLSEGDDFKLWDARGNKLYTGKNSAKCELVPENSLKDNGLDFPGRPQHIFEGILPPGINVDSPGVWVSLEEQAGETARYYVLTFSREGASHRIHIFRKIWIERTGLTIARHQMYSEAGKIIGDFQYSQATLINGFSLPLEINIDRPQDGYSLKLEVQQWQVDPDIDKGFEIIRPGAEDIPLKEKCKEP